jgi:hypothetical protein
VVADRECCGRLAADEDDEGRRFKEENLRCQEDPAVKEDTTQAQHRLDDDDDDDDK